jgi:hypothetical protein
VDLLDELDAEAERRGISVEELVDLLLVEHLPIVLAEEARGQLTGALAIAKRHAAIIDQNEQNPVAGDHEALSGEDFSRTNAEPKYTARPAPKAPSSGSAD